MYLKNNLMFIGNPLIFVIAFVLFFVGATEEGFRLLTHRHIANGTSEMLAAFGSNEGKVKLVPASTAFSPSVLFLTS